MADFILSYREQEQRGVGRTMLSQIEGSSSLAQQQRRLIFSSEYLYLYTLEQFIFHLKEFITEAHIPQIIPEDQTDLIIADFSKLFFPQFANPRAFVYAWLLKHAQWDWPTIHLFSSREQTKATIPDIVRYLKFYV